MEHLCEGRGSKWGWVHVCAFELDFSTGASNIADNSTTKDDWWAWRIRCRWFPVPGCSLIVAGALLRCDAHRLQRPATRFPATQPVIPLNALYSSQLRKVGGFYHYIVRVCITLHWSLCADSRSLSCSSGPQRLPYRR